MGLIYNHEDFSEFRYYCSQLNTITVCDDSAELEPPLVGYWPGVFFQVHGFEFTVCWEKQNVRPNTGDLFYYGVSVTSDKNLRGW